MVRKGENAGYQHFLLFSPSFQKIFFFRAVVQIRDFVVKCKSKTKDSSFRSLNSKKV